MEPLKILHLDDDKVDAEAIARALAGRFPNCQISRVATDAQFQHELAKIDQFDVVLSDFTVPGIDGFQALAAVREASPELPFLFVSGTIGGEQAVEALHRGATDYVLKDDLNRLAAAIRRALNEYAERAARVQAENDLRQRNLQLAEADRRKDEFLAMLAHELRNPLSPILTAAELLSQQDDSQPAAVIKRQTKHMARLLDDLLDVSRIERGKIRIARQAVDLKKVVEQSMESIHPLVTSGPRVSISLSEKPLWLDADPDRLEQVIVNLLTNAVKYTPQQGRVWLTVKPNPQTAEVTVRDTGVGIAPEILPTIFNKFAQAESSRDQSHGGLGLGLALVQGLVSLHGGTISAYSDGVGQGSRFVVKLPLSTSRPSPASPIVRKQAKSPFDNHSSEADGHVRERRILIVDDNVDARDMLSMYMKMKGFRVHGAVTGPDGLAAARSLRPDVILLDIDLPDMDGYQVAAELRKSPEFAETLIIATTGMGQKSDREQSAKAGIDYHLIKPIDLQKLDQKIARGRVVG